MKLPLAEFNTPFQSVPFSKITPEDLKKAMIQAIENAKENIQTILENTDTPTFQNTLKRWKQPLKIWLKSHIFYSI